jgi:molybdopterin-binding protein
MIIAANMAVAAVAPPTPCRKCDIDVAMAPRTEMRAPRRRSEGGSELESTAGGPGMGSSVRELEAAMKLSTSNILPGRVVAVTKGSTTAHVKIELAPGLMMTSSITNQAVDDLGLKVGDTVSAVIKPSDVIIGK